MKYSIRHFLATIHYRGNKYLQNYNEEFATYHHDKNIRTSGEILNHINGLLLYSKSYFEKITITYPELLSFKNEIQRFNKIVVELDKVIEASNIEDKILYQKILQGPFADIMLHIGELSMIRKIINNPADDYENYTEAPIQIGVF